MTETDRWATRRAEMVAHDLVERGIRDPRVLEAMGSVPREAFLPEALVDHAYDDAALPIGSKQTISQPYVVAAMAEAAEIDPDDHVLEIGTGSGYGAAVLARLAGTVVSVERLPELAEEARGRLARAGADTFEVVVGDGSLGWVERAPYAAVVVTAAGPVVPPALLDQLADDGRLVLPVGGRRHQRLVRIRRRGEDRIEEDLGGVTFVPLVGEEGW